MRSALALMFAGHGHGATSFQWAVTAYSKTNLRCPSYQVRSAAAVHGLSALHQHMVEWVSVQAGEWKFNGTS